MASLEHVRITILSPEGETVPLVAELGGDAQPPWKLHGGPPANWWKPQVIAYCRRRWGDGVLMRASEAEKEYKWVPENQLRLVTKV